MTVSTHRQATPTSLDIAVSRLAAQTLIRHAHPDRPTQLCIVQESSSQPFELPAGAVYDLIQILEVMATGRRVTLVPESEELTTVQAANVLNVSRPYLIKLLEEGQMPYRKVGSHRRIRVQDLMAYKARDDMEREAILEQLARESQEQGYGY